jgi:hypothetical protein
MAFIFTGHYRIDLIIGREPDLGSIQFDHIPYFLPEWIDLRCHTVNDILLLVLVDHVTEITVREKINIDHAVVVRHIILFSLGDLLHFVIKYSDPALVPVIFIDKKVTSNLPGYFKIKPAGIIFIRFRIKDLLGGGC